MESETPTNIREMLARLPQWLRVDLSANDTALRERAEDTLTAMTLAAINADALPPITCDPVRSDDRHGA